MVMATDQFSFFPPPPAAEQKPGVQKPPAPLKIKEAEVISHFDEWWSTACWHKEAKGAARRAYLRAVQTKNVTPQQLIDGARRYADFLARNPTRPPKHPATWLNAECWGDVYSDDRLSSERARSSAHAGAARLFSGRHGLR